MKGYQTNQWKTFREEIIKLDARCCSICGRKEPDVILQVHHTHYIAGKNPWEYELKDCITICKGCHAQEHGKIRPNSGWEYMGEEDLGGLSGECDYCHTRIRYIHYIFHENWSIMGVGTNCCDSLTESEIGQKRKLKLVHQQRLKKFIHSKDWSIKDNEHSITYNRYLFTIKSLSDIANKVFYISVTQDIENPKYYDSSKRYKNLDDAKIKIFESLSNGSLRAFFSAENKSKSKHKNLI